MTNQLVNVTISGRVGAGKTTIARALESRGWGFVSNGDVFRQEAERRNMSVAELTEECMLTSAMDRLIDEGTAKLALEREHTVFDGRLAFRFAPNSLRVYVDCPPNIAGKRVFAERRPLERFETVSEAIKATVGRHEAERERFLKVYGLDMDDLSNYDIVLDGTRPVEENLTIIEDAARAIDSRWRATRAWESYGDTNFAEWGGCLCRIDEDIPVVAEVFQLYAPLALSEDQYRAFLYSIDTDDIDRETLVTILDMNGFLTSDRTRLTESFAKRVGCDTELSDRNLQRVSYVMGSSWLAVEMVCLFGASYAQPMTYHDDIEGALTGEEVGEWAKALGFASYVPTLIYERVGTDSKALPEDWKWSVRADGQGRLLDGNDDEVASYEMGPGWMYLPGDEYGQPIPMGTTEDAVRACIEREASTHAEVREHAASIAEVRPRLGGVR